MVLSLGGDRVEVDLVVEVAIVVVVVVVVDLLRKTDVVVVSGATVVVFAVTGFRDRGFLVDVPTVVVLVLGVVVVDLGTFGFLVVVVVVVVVVVEEVVVVLVVVAGTAGTILDRVASAMALGVVASAPSLKLRTSLGKNPLTTLDATGDC